METKSCENLIRLVLFLYSPVAPVVRNLMKHYLRITKKTLSELIDDNQHDLFHLYSNDRCCQCNQQKDPIRKRKLVLNVKQMKLLFNTNRRLAGHKNGNLCCCYSHPIDAAQLDITLLKCLLINLCKDVFWDVNLKIRDSNNFENILSNRKHDIYHLWEHLVTCCQCHRHYTRPTSKKIEKIEFLELFSFDKKKCDLEDACAYQVKSGIQYIEIQSELQLFSKLSDNLFPLRQAVNKIADIRNSIFHNDGEMPSDKKFEEYWDILKNSIIYIQDAIGSKTCTEEHIDQLKTKQYIIGDIDDQLMKLLTKLNTSNTKFQKLILNSCRNKDCLILHPNELSKALKITENDDNIGAKLKSNCNAVGLTFSDETPRDGNCFFHAVSCQLGRLELDEKEPLQLRIEVVDYLKENRTFEVDGEEVDINKFLTDTFDNWSNKMKGDGEFADHIAVQGTAIMLRTDILIVTSSPESNPKNCLVYIIGENNFSGIPILLGHYWENHYQSLKSLPLNCGSTNQEINNNAVCIMPPDSSIDEVDQKFLFRELELWLTNEGIDMDEYKVTGAKIQLTLEKRNKITERDIQILDNKGGGVEHKDMTSTNNFEDVANESSIESDGDYNEDILICGKCKEMFNKVHLFTNHTGTCEKRKSKKRDNKVQEGQEIQAQITITQVQVGIPPTLVPCVRRAHRRLTNDLDVDESVIVELIEEGSLVIWTKLNSSVVRSRGQFTDNMDRFMVNLFRKCPIETEKETKFSVKIDIIDSTEDEDDDEFICGKCKETFKSLSSFCTHKKICLRHRKCIESPVKVKNEAVNIVSKDQGTSIITQEKKFSNDNIYSESAYSSLLSDTGETTDNSNMKYPPIECRLKSKKKNRSAKQRRKMRVGGSRSETTTSGYETGQSSEIELKFEWGNEEDNYLYYYRKEDIESDDVNSDAGLSVNEKMNSPESNDNENENTERKDEDDQVRGLLTGLNTTNKKSQTDSRVRKVFYPNELLKALTRNEDEEIGAKLKSNCHAVGLAFSDETPRDGNCFFHAVSCQLRRLGLDEREPLQLRIEVVDYLKENRKFEVDGTKVKIDDFLADTFDNWSKKMKGDGQFADHIAVQATARMLRTDILIVTSSLESNPKNCIVYIIGENNFFGIPILLGHYWENHYQSLESLPQNCCNDNIHSESAYSSLLSDTGETTDNSSMKYPPIEHRLKSKKKSRSAKQRRKIRDYRSAGGSRSETTSGYETGQSSEIELKFEWGNEEDNYLYYDRKEDIESDDVNSDAGLSVNEKMSSPELSDNENENTERKVRIDYYEKSVISMTKAESRKKLSDTQMIQYGIQLSHKCLAELTSKFRKQNKKYTTYYSDFMEDRTTLLLKCEKNPDKYRKGIVTIRSSHDALCTLFEPFYEIENVELSGRSKCGKVFTGDEVVVEIPSGQTTYLPRMNKTITTSKSVYGKVIGRLKRNRYEGIDHPVLVCELDKFEYNKAIPVCKTVPKFHLLSENHDENYFSIDVYKYDENAMKIVHSHTLKVSPTSRRHCLFYVAYISWHSLYPLGAIIKVHESTEDFMSGLTILELQNTVPTLYSEGTIKCVDRSLDIQFLSKKENRFDLTKVCNVFTIDPIGSKVLDDAVSICKLKTGGFRVGVHITDASSFVEINSELDKEARERGTTFFRGHFGDPHQMLPEPISTDKCSLVAGKNKLAVTIFYHFNERLECIHADTKCCKSIINSREQFSYAQVQNIIEGRESSNWKDDILNLFKVSKTLRQKRLGDGMFSIPYEFELSENEENNSNYPEAYYLIEELMILTNHSIASFLLRTFPDCIPLRCQDSPPTKKIKEWKKAYPLIADMILKLQGCLTGTKRESEMNLRYNDIVFVQRWLWRNVMEHIKNGEEEKAAALLCKEELHPFHAMALHDWKYIQSFAEYRCSGYHKNSKGKHFNLGIFPYAHFTAPIRRYVDLVVHRLLHAAIDKEESPYSADSIHEICQDINKIMSRAKRYDQECQSLLLAYHFRKAPVVVHGFISECSNDKDISLVIPGLDVLSKHDKTLKINLLGVHERPKYKRDVDKLNSAADRKYMVLTWKSRIYSRLRTRPYPKNPSDGYKVLKGSTPQKIDPHQKSDFKQMTLWIEYIQKLITKRNSSQLSNQASNLDTGESLSKSFLHSSLDTENDVNSEIIDPTKEKTEINSMLTKQFCNYSMDFRHGQVIAIQYSSEMRRGILTPYIQVFDMTRNLKYCLEHMRDPIQCLEKYSTTATKTRYDNSEEYKNIWIPIILMETAMTVVRDYPIILNDIFVSFNADGGSFTLASNFCFERNIDFSSMSINFVDTEKIQYIPSSDYLCIKCVTSTKDGEYFQPQKTTAPHEYKIWTKHAKIDRLSIVNKNTADEKYRIYFKNLGSKSRRPPGHGEKNPKCSVEILVKPEMNKRTEVIVGCLNTSTLLAKAIALNRKPPTLDEDHIQNITDSDVDIGLPLNNNQQTKAIKMALKSTFSLIHGPPGTGKTNMGIKLVVLFNEINRKIEENGGRKSQIIYCGPSNKSVDLVANRILRLTRGTKSKLKIARLYGSSIERLDFPVPGRVSLTRHMSRESKTDENLKDISIHHLIRQPGKKFADKINASSLVDTEEIKAYIQLVREATIEELSHYDVIFCTTAMATSVKLLKGMKDKIFQVIIDECGMCTEPESIATIIATRANQVVLIGDHKQLQPIVVCPEARRLGLRKSLFERYKDDEHCVQLQIQYRMHPSICEFPSNAFYGDKLKTDVNSKSYVEDRPLMAWFDKDKRTIFCHIYGEEEILPVSTEEGNEKSRRNKEEVKQVVKIYRHLVENEKIFRSSNITVNIMSQYNDQCAAIRESLTKAGYNGVNVNTVVASQGGEWDYVIFSLVRSLPEYRIEKMPTLGWCAQNLGFITDMHQINVALTRAKKGLFIIGNKHLLKCNSVWKNLIESYDRKGCLVKSHLYPPPHQPKQPKTKTKKKHEIDEEGFKLV